MGGSTVQGQGRRELVPEEERERVEVRERERARARVVRERVRVVRVQVRVRVLDQAEQGAEEGRWEQEQEQGGIREGAVVGSADGPSTWVGGRRASWGWSRSGGGVGGSDARLRAFLGG